MDKFSKERKHFPILGELLYFNTPSFGLVPDYVWEATRNNIDERFHSQNIGVACMSQYEMIEKVRPVYANLINAESSDIAFGLSSSQMYVILSSNLPVKPGENVVMTDNSFITTPFAFNARETDGIEVRMAKTVNGYISAKALCSYVDKNTSVIAINHVESNTGYRIDMEYVGEFCRKYGIIFAVDAAQSAGAMEIDVKRMNIDFLVGTDYKWLCHFRGVGFAYVSEKLRKTLCYRGAGWGSDLNRFDTDKRHLDPHPDARRYEYGGFHNIGIYCVAQVIEHYLALGKKDVQNYILSLADYCYEKVNESEYIDIAYPFAPENRSGVVVLKVAGKYKLSSEMLKPFGIVASVNGGLHPDHGSPSENYTIRLGLHYFITKEDIDRLFEAIEFCCIQ